MESNKTEKELKAEIEHLRDKIRQDTFKPCHRCNTKLKYSEVYDSFYCPTCEYWTERICSDRECSYCKDKPKYPGKDQK